jgi:hypothetical protein
MICDEATTLHKCDICTMHVCLDCIMSVLQTRVPEGENPRLPDQLVMSCPGCRQPFTTNKRPVALTIRCKKVLRLPSGIELDYVIPHFSTELLFNLKPLNLAPEMTFGEFIDRFRSDFLNPKYIEMLEKTPNTRDYKLMSDGGGSYSRLAFCLIQQVDIPDLRDQLFATSTQHLHTFKVNLSTLGETAKFTVRHMSATRTQKICYYCTKPRDRTVHGVPVVQMRKHVLTKVHKQNVLNIVTPTPTST